MKVLNYLIESDFWNDINLENPNVNISLLKDVAEIILEYLDKRSKKNQIKIFEVEIADEYILDFNLNKDEYKTVFNNLIPKLLEYEEYELCARIKKYLDDSCLENTLQ